MREDLRRSFADREDNPAAVVSGRCGVRQFPRYLFVRFDVRGTAAVGASYVRRGSAADAGRPPTVPVGVVESACAFGWTVTHLDFSVKRVSAS